jgi:hypothetical protein
MKVIKEIIALEKLVFDEEAYLDESQQTKLQILYQVLGRVLSQSEKETVYKERLEFMQECLGEKSEDWLNKKMYYEN